MTTKRKQRGAKFRVGDEVMDTMTEEKFRVSTVHFDPCDGWEYLGARNLWYFEEDLELIHAVRR